MKDKELKEFIAKGHILCRVIFEMAGNPKEHVEKTLKNYINAIKEDPNYIFLKEEYAPCEETEEGGVWSTFLESEVLITNLDHLNNLCFNLSPASVEILEPEEFHLNQKKVGELYNDLLSKIHEVSITIKNMSSENELLKVNINRLIKNSVLSTLNEPKNADEIGLKIGIDKEHLKPFLDAMIREKSIIEENDKYRINNQK